MSRRNCAKIREISSFFGGLRPAFCYHAMPITGGNAVPSSPEQVPVSYRNMADARMEQFLDLILGAGTGVLFFCTAGKDRTEVVSALLLHRLGADRETILRDYLQSAENLRASLEAYAAQTGIDPAIIIPCRDFMEQFLDGLK